MILHLSAESLPSERLSIRILIGDQNSKILRFLNEYGEFAFALVLVAGLLSAI